MADEQPTPEVTETEPAGVTPATPEHTERAETPKATQFEQFPADHPLVKTLEEQKATIKELKTKASRFDQLEAEKQRETQSWQERAEAAENALKTLQDAKQISDWKDQVASMKKYEGVTAKALRGTTLEEIEEHAADLKALLPEARTPGAVPGEGRTVTRGIGDRRQQFADIIQKGT